jgi:hypothetical protein
MFRNNGNYLMRCVIDDYQVLERATRGDAIKHKVHGPDLVAAARPHERLPIGNRDLLAPATLDMQLLEAIESFDTLMVDDLAGQPHTLTFVLANTSAQLPAYTVAAALCKRSCLSNVSGKTAVPMAAHSCSTSSSIPRCRVPLVCASSAAGAITATLPGGGALDASSAVLPRQLGACDMPDKSSWSKADPDLYRR